MLKYRMKIFESSLRPVSADKRLVAREVAFNPNPVRERSVSFLHSIGHPKSLTDHEQLKSPGKVNMRPNSSDRSMNVPSPRRERAGRRIVTAEKRFAVQRDREMARLQLERAWLKREIVSILRVQYIHQSTA